MSKNEVKNRAAQRYDDATKRARGELVEQPSTELGGDMVVKPTGLEAILTRVDNAHVAAELESGDFEAAPQLLKLEAGQMLTAYLEGESQTELVDKDTGEVDTVRTWILSKGALRVSILSTVQLDKKLPPFVGEVVRIVRGEDKRIGTKIYTDYLVYGPKRSDGSKRFTFAPTSKQLPAPVTPSNTNEG